jgi:rhamnosyltransferase
LTPKQLCAVIVSYNSPENVMKCIKASVDEVDRIIVIDNSTESALRSTSGRLDYSGKVIFEFNESNRGLGVALNQGIRHSMDNGYTWTLLLDQDSVPSENMVKEMLKSYENLDDKTKKDTAAVVTSVFERNFKKVLPSVVMTNLFNKKVEAPKADIFVDFHITSGSLLRNEIISKIGLMNEEFFIDFIDFDYCFRILEAKYKILLSNNALLYHSLAECKHRFFFHFREHSYRRIFYQVRNRFFVIFKYGTKYRSFLYSESLRLLAKFFKILLLESEKRKKMWMYLKGIVYFLRDYKKMNADF